MHRRPRGPSARSLSAPLHCIGRIVLLLTLLVVGGCSTYSNDAARLRERVSTGDVSGALQWIEERGGEDPDVLDLFEKGLLLYYDGQYLEAARTLERAAVEIDELYTKSISRELGAFLTNDGTRPYTGYPAEQVLLHTYAALAYLFAGDTEAALVATRAASQRLAVLEDQRAEKKGYDDDAFAQWIAAMLYAEDGDGNACLVSCRRALAAYRQARELWGQPIPMLFLEDYAIWARRFGFEDEAERLAEEFGDPVRNARAPLPDEGEVFLVYESGFVDHLEEARMDFPILEGDRDDDDDWATRVYRRGTRSGYVVHDDVKVKYWLSIAVPFVVETPSTLDHARLVSGDREASTEPAHDVSAIFRLTFEEGATARVTRTIARALAKYAAVEAIKGDEKSDGQKLFGFAANLFASATERADTRSWTMLPDRLHVARLRLPAGRHPVRVEVLGPGGRVAQRVEFEAVEVRAGSRTILHHRSFR